MFSSKPVDFQYLNYIEVHHISDAHFDLQSSITNEKIFVTAQHPGPSKTPRPNELQKGFYKANWEIVVEDVFQIMQRLVVGQFSWEYVNKTDIISILKVKNPISLSDFRLISLCNVIYKIRAKVLRNRLSEVLPSIIS